MWHLWMWRADWISCSCFYAVGIAKGLAKHGCLIYVLLNKRMDIVGSLRTQSWFWEQFVPVLQKQFICIVAYINILCFPLGIWRLSLGDVRWRLWRVARRKKKEDNLAWDIFFFASFCWQLTLCTCKPHSEKLSLKRKTPWKFKVSKLLSLKGAISHLILEITAYDFQPFSEIRCEFWPLLTW